MITISFPLQCSALLLPLCSIGSLFEKKNLLHVVLMVF